MHVEDLHAPRLVRPVHQHLPVEPSRAQQRRIEDLRPVGRGEQHDAASGVEAVQLDQELVQRLLLLVVSAGQGADAAGAAERVQLVDEDDGRRLLSRLLEQVAHARGADADEHLDEFRAGDREERHAGFARDRLGQQRLAGAGRADQQHAFRHASAEPTVAGGVLEEVDDLLQLVLRLVHAGNVGEGDLRVGLDVDLRLALAELHQSAAESLIGSEAAHDEPPHANEQKNRHKPAEQRAKHVALHSAVELDAVLLQLIREIRVYARRAELGGTVGQLLLERALNIPIGDIDVGDLAFPKILLELAIRDRGDGYCGRNHAVQKQHAEHRRQSIPDIEPRFLIHRASSGSRHHQSAGQGTWTSRMMPVPPIAREPGTRPPTARQALPEPVGPAVRNHKRLL